MTHHQTADRLILPRLCPGGPDADRCCDVCCRCQTERMLVCGCCGPQCNDCAPPSPRKRPRRRAHLFAVRPALRQAFPSAAAMTTSPCLPASSSGAKNAARATGSRTTAPGATAASTCAACTAPASSARRAAAAPTAAAARRRSSTWTATSSQPGHGDALSWGDDDVPRRGCTC